MVLGEIKKYKPPNIKLLGTRVGLTFGSSFLKLCKTFIL